MKHMSDDNEEMLLHMGPSEGCIIVREKRLECMVPDPAQCETPEEADEAYYVTTTMTYLMYCMERDDWRVEFTEEMTDAGLDPGINYAAQPEVQWDPSPELEVLEGSGESTADSSKNPGLRLVREGEEREDANGLHGND